MATTSFTARTWATIIDRWTAFSYKVRWANPLIQMKPMALPGWVNGTHQRRLAAYSMLEAYYRNASRMWLDAELDEDKRRGRREYGDAHVVVDQTMSSLIGDSLSFRVQGAMGGEDPTAVAVQEAITAWWEAELMEQKIVEAERNAVKLGDGVLTITWDPKRKRPIVNIYNPGFYFPVLDPSAKAGDSWPRKVHMAWEFEEEEVDGSCTLYVRRVTWELRDYPPGQERRVVYQEDPITETCVYYDGIWPLDGIGRDVNLFDDSKARWVQEPIDLEIDFIPVIHIPNTVSIEEHYGESVLASSMQILDDIVATDTDLQAAAGTTGAPPIAISGATIPTTQTTYGPGTLLNVGDGTATIIDTSRSLDALLKLKDALLERLSVNARIPESLLGRVKPNEVPSGIALTLSFAPHAALIYEMRLVRKQKYGIMFKFVQRFMMMYGDLPEVAKVDIVFGSFLPADKQEVMTIVAQLLPINAMSLETAVAMMQEAGYPVDDIVDEIARIHANDLGRAQQMVSLTGDVNLGRQAIGLPPDPTFSNVNLNDPNATVADPNAPGIW